MAEFPAFPLWTDAYEADCGHLSDAEHGRYLMILRALWRAPNQRLPNDNDWLARRFRRSVDDVISQMRPLIAEFCQNDGNWITQKRLSREWGYVKAASERQSVRAKRRWNNNKTPSRGNAEPHSSSRTAPTPTKNHERKDHEERQDAARAKTNGNGHLVPHRGPTRGLRSMGEILSTEKRKKDQSVANAHMIQFFIGKNWTLTNATELVTAARDPEHPDHINSRRICEQHSRDNRLGWFGRES